MNRGGESVIGTLPHIDMIVRVNRFFRGQPIATGQFDRPIGDHLVDIHIARRAGSGLKYVDRKLIVQFAVDDILGGGQHWAT